jgi:hypothetical protein
MSRKFRLMIASIATATLSTFIFAQEPKTGEAKTGDAKAAEAKKDAPAAPAPAPAAPAASTGFFPNAKGNSWQYKSGENQIELVIGDAGTLDTMVGGKKVASETIEVKPDGIYRTKVNGVSVEPAVKLLALPIDTKDVSWEVSSKLNAQEIKGKFTQKGNKEKIKILDKEYETVYVEGLDFTIANTKCTLKQWFAEGKYLVKMVYSIGGNESMIELKEFKGK